MHPRSILFTVLLCAGAAAVRAETVPADRAQRDHLIAIARRVYDRGLIFGTGGDISVRVPGADYFYIKATGTCMGDMTYADQAKVYLDGHVPPDSPDPSHETNIHVALYNRYPDIGAIMHIHSPYAAAWASVGKLVPAVTQQSAPILKGMKIVHYGAPGSKKLLDDVVGAYEPGTTVVLMENHGAFVVGTDLNDILYKGEVLENTARIAYLMRSLGDPVKFEVRPNEPYPR